jgi:beta-N-acetylhexosaminidase
MGKILWQALILFAFFTGISSFRSTGFPSVENSIYNYDYKVEPAFTTIDASWADSVLGTLSLEEKIAQSLMVAAYSNRGEDHLREVSTLIEEYGVGGIIFFQGGPVRQANMTNHFQQRSKIPLLVAIDGEWGLGMRLDSTISYPRQMSLGAIRDDDMIYQMGYSIGKQLRRIGVHVNFAPVADVNNNPLNPVINFRSFGEDRRNVANKSFSYSRGLEDAGVIATMKHFPGHGDTNSDSHYTLPVILHNTERLDSIELYPFKYCISKGVTALMTAHLNIPALDSAQQLASSLSYPIVTGLLKEKLQFNGLIFTDALNMRGVSDYFKPGELEAMAYIAGNDILLMPSDVEKAINSIKREVKRGIIQLEEIDSRCRKILMAKKWAGLHEDREIKISSIYEDLKLAFLQIFQE